MKRISVALCMAFITLYIQPSDSRKTISERDYSIRFFLLAGASLGTGCYSMFGKAAECNANLDILNTKNCYIAAGVLGAFTGYCIYKATDAANIPPQNRVKKYD